MNYRKLGLISLLILVSLTIHCRQEEGPTELHFTLTFKDAQQLRPGQFFLYKGVRIGQATSVTLDGSGVVKVSMTVDETHREQVYREATFTIEKLSLLNPSGEHQIVMTDGGDTHTPIEEGAVIAGSEGWLSDAAEKAGQLVNTATDLASDAAKKLGDKAKKP